jgi:SAM-dependent methyltransferase
MIRPNASEQGVREGVGASLSATGLSQVEPQEGLAPSGFDPSRVVLDACCGSRMFWFDRRHPAAVFIDNRSERHSLADKSSRGGCRELVIAPDLVADFTALPLPSEHFALVVFDPPHLVGNGRSGWLAKKYGKLGDDWREDLRKGFSECFRVLRPEGVLVFKWNEHEVPVSEVLSLTDAQPLFGNRCGKNAKSHWLVFMKPRDSDGSPKGGDGEAGSVHDSAAPSGDRP